METRRGIKKDEESEKSRKGKKRNIKYATFSDI